MNNKMNWIEITTLEQLDRISEISKSTPCVIYKHNTQCNTSEMMKYVLESDWKFKNNEVQPFILDIFQYASIAIAVEDKFQVHHQSPQVLLIKSEECTYDADNMEISVEELIECLEDDFWG
ncbi:MAG: bacillithiol system protein YtxJ [Saprospiraceae bacterium]|jgi:bacillithiol system protein YtxJ|tara:strand:- start:292 stop:654 length:363 start_codon:yes stop_codon:yes gene_type:complete